MPASLLGAALGDYRVIAPLGIGAAGAVYLAEHPLLGRRVAVKVLHADLSRNPEAVERCFAEARAASEIGDPRIGRVLEQGVHGPFAYLVVEHLEARTLGELLERGALPVAQALDIADGIAAALDSAHAVGLVHGALKAENVFVFEPHRGVFDVKVVDFGIERLGWTRRSRSTSAYLAPEQCAGLTPDVRSDVYALGTLLFEMVTGVRPFTGSEDDVVIGHLTHPAPPATSIRPSIPAAVQSTVARALEKRRGRRFQTMSDFRSAILDPVTTQPIPTPQPNPQPNPLPMPPPSLSSLPSPPPSLSPSLSRSRSPSRSHTLRLLLAASIAALVLTVGALRVLSAPSPAPVSPKVAAHRSSITVTIDPTGLPDGARVHLHGVDAGAPGDAIVVPRGTEPVHVSIHAPGFLPFCVRFVPDKDRLIAAVLVPRPPSSPSFL